MMYWFNSDTTNCTRWICVYIVHVYVLLIRILGDNVYVHLFNSYINKLNDILCIYCISIINFFKKERPSRRILLLKIMFMYLHRR